MYTEFFMSKPYSPSPILMNRALAGNAEAQFKIAERYMQSGHEDDVALAEEWALKAAENGLAEAMYWLGEGYTVYAKEILEEDKEEAIEYFNLGFKWLFEASQLKHPAALLELAGYYRRADVVDKDLEKSISLVTQSAELGYAQAMRDLACIYEHGLGVDIDLAKADEWNDKAQVAEQDED